MIEDGGEDGVKPEWMEIELSDRDTIIVKTGVWYFVNCD